MINMRNDFSSLETFEQLTQAAGDFLITDAATAETLLEIAEKSSNAADRSRRLEKAREALNTIDRFMGRLRLAPGQRLVLEHARDRLEAHLMVVEGVGKGTGTAQYDDGGTEAWPFPEGRPRPT